MDDKNIVTFVTTNKGKIASAQKHFADVNVKLITYNYELIEPRTDDIKEIVTSKVKQAYEIVNTPCIALDTGFFIEALNGFPRAFVNFALNTINIDGFLKLMKDEENRVCCFKECLAYYDGNKIKYFSTIVPGTLATEKLGKDNPKKWSDLWYIFIPDGFNKTIAEMSDDERYNSVLSTTSSIKDFAIWYKKNVI